MSVPKVRNAVHKATAPSEYALPKTRERLAMPAAAPAPCSVIGATPLSAGYMEDMQTPLSPGEPGITGTPFVPTSYTGPGSKSEIIDPLPGGGGAVPEPHTWLQFLVGFTLIGGAVRMARKRPTEEEEELLDRVEELKKQA
jgi:hypothetical protein